MSEQPPSGLRNPTGAIRGAAAGALAAEGVVLLLAIQPMRVLGVELTRWAVITVVALAIVCFVTTGLLKRAWAWPLAVAIQVALVIAGFVFHWALAVLGVLFGLVWAYILHVRATVSRPPRR
jgi:hypothetical protein